MYDLISFGVLKKIPIAFFGKKINVGARELSEWG